MKKAMSDQSDNCIKVQLGDAMSFGGDEKQGFDWRVLQSIADTKAAALPKYPHFNIEGDSQKQHKLNETLQVQRFISCHCFLVIIASLLASLKLMGWGVSRLSQVSTFQDYSVKFPPFRICDVSSLLQCMFKFGESDILQRECDHFYQNQLHEERVDSISYIQVIVHHLGKHGRNIAREAGVLC